MSISFKTDVEYLKDIYEDEYKEKISLQDFWDTIVSKIEDLIREGGL